MFKPAALQSNLDISRKLYGLVLAIALFIAIVPPLGYFWLSYQFQGNETQVEAKLYSAFVTLIIHGDAENWQAVAQDEIDQELLAAELPEQRSIVGARGNLIAQYGDSLAWPILTRSNDLIDAHGSLVGYMKISRSLTPVLYKTGFVALGGLALGMVMFLILYTLPLRALNRTLGALQAEKQTAQENAERLRVVIDNADEGIIALDPAGLVQSFNAAAERIFGYTGPEILGRNADLFMPVTPGNPGKFLVTGHSEAIGRHKQGKEFPIEIVVSKAFEQALSQFICIVRDITERKQVQEKLNFLANYDSLTNLPNRNLFKDRLTQALLRASRNNTLVALMFLDLDRFKTINDTLGHGSGDRLLQQVAKLLQNALRASDNILFTHAKQPTDALNGENYTVSRLGGDEFTIILEDIANVDAIGVVAQKILAVFGQPVLLGVHEIYVSASIGIAVYPFDDIDQDNLVKHADTAMYRSKELGRNNFQFYTKNLNPEANNRLALETDLRRAIERNEFILYYQPKIDLASNEIVGVEALLRWQHPVKGLISPLDFIPILEETGLIIPVGDWALRNACMQNKVWQMSGLKPLQMAVNLSVRQFMQTDLTKRVADALQAANLEPSLLELEITESLLMKHTDFNISMLAELSALGVRISIDDFGTGYSSLSYLKRFSVHALKIDRSFVRDLASDADDSAIVRAVIALANNLGLEVIAEGIETEEQLTMLRDLGCHQGQGYLLGRPMLGESLAAYLRERSHAVKEPSVIS